MGEFEDIRPYNFEEAKAAYLRLSEEPRFQDVVRQCLPNYSMEEFRDGLEKWQSISDIQLNFIRPILEVFIKSTTHGLTLSGIENTDLHKSYLYISNHRDITFDPAMLQYYFFVSGHLSSRICIGNNLLTTPLVGEIGRTNKMIVVKRDATDIRERLENSHHLAAYIQQSLFEDNESVWIAQRDGRTKNGDDFTKQGLLKMITMGHTKDLLQTIKAMNIVPMTISYEYEPCDALKAREEAMKELGHYEKQPGEDFSSIKHGIFQQKGRVALTLGTPLHEEIDTIDPELNNNLKLDAVCKLIDKQIYQNYQLYPNNYIANDMLHNASTYADFYTEEDKANFQVYLQRQSVCADVAPEKMKHYLLRIYGTPVDNHNHKFINEHQ
ncbi:MAG: 1-acyl-sn-glycerol-3-phosphate acyltransferase [Bacteroidales bacterium]|nr:1-acyl-sn-glycerol-3-phosphate acyltransferase [Bacteroidales bacterium]